LPQEPVFHDFAKTYEGAICPVCGEHTITIRNGIEVGNIFQLGTKYTTSMDMQYVDSNGILQYPIMGCYGIGVERTAAAIIEQHHDENGIVWPIEVAPYHVVVVPVNIKKEEQMNIADKIYTDLKSLGIEVLIDDRDERVGVKFKDSELIGIPIRITVGKDIENGKVEFKLRNKNDKELANLEGITSKVLEILLSNNMKL
jgi:prolyl-tRNA synthetase